MLYRCSCCQNQFDTMQIDLTSGICPDCGKRFPGDLAGKTIRDFINRNMSAYVGVERDAEISAIA